jgi:hypothetical protein
MAPHSKIVTRTKPYRELPEETTLNEMQTESFDKARSLRNLPYKVIIKFEG